MWVTALDFNRVIRIDPKTSRVVKIIEIPSPAGIAINENGVWVANHRQDMVTKIDPQRNEVVASVLLGGPGPSAACSLCVEAIAADASGIWVTLAAGNAVVHIDSETNQILGTISAVGTQPAGIVLRDNEIWVSAAASGRLTRIDFKTGQIVGAMNIPPAAGIAVGNGDIWVGDILQDKVLRIKPTQ